MPAITDEEGLARAIERDAAVIALLTEAVPREIDRDFPPELGLSICILGARVGHEVLRHYGIGCRTLACQLTVFNEAMVSRVGREAHMPKDDAEMKRWAREDGSWSVGTGGEGVNTPQGRFDGHVVSLAFPGKIPEVDGVLIDLSLQQQSRPQRKIVLEPLTTVAPRGFLGGEEVCIAEMHGCICRYRHLPDSFDWCKVPDWRDAGRRHFIIERSIAKIDAALIERGLG